MINRLTINDLICDTMNARNLEECIKFALDKHNIKAASFEEANYRIFERSTVNAATMFTALRKGGVVIPVVKASLFDSQSQGETATVVVRANQITDIVDLFVPDRNEVQSFPIDSFVEAWDAMGGVCMTAFPQDARTYFPKLIDLRDVDLPDEIDDLREAIAENAHDRWALERQSEGWTYGPKRDDAKLETPDMVPYAQLPESEKQYDRIMAEDTLKLLMTLGYKIEKDA